MISYFKEIGRSLEEAWRDRGYDETVFPELAAELLQESSPNEQVAIADIIDWLFQPYCPVPQPASFGFGQPPVKLYQGNGFFIEVLFWLDSTTAIHQHAFSGAFTPIYGSSVHSEWHFETARKVNSHMSLGRLQRDSTEILTPGLVRLIRAGSDYIRSCLLW